MGVLPRRQRPDELVDELLAAHRRSIPWPGVDAMPRTQSMEEDSMHATLRRLRCEPGKSAEVARLIETEYIPQLEDVEGTVSYTLVHVGDDEIRSLGLFSTESGAIRANELAAAWAKERLAGHGAAPLEASDGEVMLHRSFAD
jgi:hypothetical protein